MEGLKLHMDDFNIDNHEPDSFPFPAGGVFGARNAPATSTSDFVLGILDRFDRQLTRLDREVDEAFAIHPTNNDTWPPFAA